MFLEFAKMSEKGQDDVGWASLESKNALQRHPRHIPTSRPHCGDVRARSGWMEREGGGAEREEMRKFIKCKTFQMIFNLG